MNTLNLSTDIKLVDLPEGQFIKEETTKVQIYLHHTAGNQDAEGVFKYWQTTPERVATSIVIAGKPKTNDTFVDGQIVQGYSSKYWAYHLGLKQSTFHNFNLPYKSLDKNAIGIEICNWGALKYVSGKFYNLANRAVTNEEVTILDTPFRGNKYFQSYTDAQIVSVEKLLRYFGQKYNIPLTFNPDIFTVNAKALSGTPGVWSHTSVRYDKNDIYPHPKLIEMLKSL